jgi:MFS family permease
MLRIAILLLFLFSGISGLIYEVVWTRLLTSILGNTIYAVSIVLSAFMAGLSIGSLIAGRYIDARKDSLKIYALLELCIGVTGFCLTLILNQTGPLYIWIHHALSGHGIFLSLGRYLFAFIILAVPTTLMGATLPVLSKFAVDRMSIIGMTVGMLYAVNTFGAAAGCYAAGFLFIGSIGILQTVFIASVINITIGTTAWFIRNVRITLPLNRQSEEPDESDKRKPTPLLGRIALVAFAVSGFVAMGYEITWTRILITYSVCIFRNAYLIPFRIGTGESFTFLFCQSILETIRLFWHTPDWYRSLYNGSPLFFWISFPALTAFFKSISSSNEYLRHVPQSFSSHACTYYSYGGIVSCCHPPVRYSCFHGCAQSQCALFLEHHRVHHRLNGHRLSVDAATRL